MGEKLKFVISDLHLGAGYAHPGPNLLEDFTATKEFVAFLRQIWRESERDGREVELMINGDFFEFLQVPAVDQYEPGVVYPIEAYHDSSQQATIKRLDIVAAGHPAIFNALSDFMHVEAPQRRITLIKGNHDVCLYWPGVKSHLRDMLGASGTRASLLRFADEFVSREQIYVEHGHQRAEKMNGFHDSFDPRSFDDPTQLYHPAGSRFVIDFFNEVEPERWFVDHIKPLTTLIWFAFRWNFDFASQALAAFIRHTPALVVSNMNLDNHIITAADTLLQELENEDKRRELARQYAADAAFRLEFHQQVQQYVDDANIDNKGAADLPPFTLSDDPLEMGRADQKWQQQMLRQAAKNITDQEGAKVILFGHTHYPVQEQLDNGSLYINTGSWVEDFSDASPETWKALFSGARAINTPPRHLPYARIDYDEDGNPSASLHYFKGSVATGSTVAPPAVLEARSPRPGLFDWFGRLLRAGS